MISGIVYWEEIIANIKDETGISNLVPYYPTLRRAVINAENDIAASGLIIRKTKTYNIADSDYDGYTLILPTDFMGEYSEAEINNAIWKGDRIELKETPGPDMVDLEYMGLLLDQNGNPLTTRNHLEAVVKACVIKLYAPMMFLGKGNANHYYAMKREYDMLVMAARGNDAFPTESQWKEIGITLGMSKFDAVSDCGLVEIRDPLAPADGGGDSCEQGNLTVDMVALYFQAKND